MTIKLPPTQVALARDSDGNIDEHGAPIVLDAEHTQVAGFDCTWQDGYDWIDTMAGAGWTTVSSWVATAGTSETGRTSCSPSKPTPKAKDTA